MKLFDLSLWIIILCFAVIVFFGCSATKTNSIAFTTDPFLGNWALILPDGNAAWLSFSKKDEIMKGEIWTVGAPNAITEMSLSQDTLYFKRKCKIGDPDYPGGSPTGERVLVQNQATVKGDKMELIMDNPLADGSIQALDFSGKRLPPLPPKPDLSKVVFEDAVVLFNGENLNGWRLTNPNQRNGWKVEDGILVNESLNFPSILFPNMVIYGQIVNSWTST